MKAGTHTQVPVPMTKYSKKDDMKAGAHTQVPVPMTTYPGACPHDYQETEGWLQRGQHL